MNARIAALGIFVAWVTALFGCVDQHVHLAPRQAIRLAEDGTTSGEVVFLAEGGIEENIGGLVGRVLAVDPKTPRIAISASDLLWGYRISPRELIVRPKHEIVSQRRITKATQLRGEILSLISAELSDSEAAEVIVTDVGIAYDGSTQAAAPIPLPQSPDKHYFVINSVRLTHTCCAEFIPNPALLYAVRAYLLLWMAERSLPIRDSRCEST